jgi:hypothetical protein
MTIDRASVERLAQYISPDVRAVMLAQADRIDALEYLLCGAETVLEAWDRGDEADFRQAIEEMRADVEAMK